MRKLWILGLGLSAIGALTAAAVALNPPMAGGKQDKLASMYPGVRVVSPDELNEIDLTADVRIVSADELNEIDLAARPDPQNANPAK